MTRDFLIDEEKEDPGRDGLMELERNWRGEYNPAGGSARGAIIGETLPSICQLTDENIPGGWHMMSDGVMTYVQAYVRGCNFIKEHN